MDRLRQIKCFLFDMDGTIYLGNTLLPGIAEFFHSLRNLGKQYYFVTNNSSKGHVHYADKLNRLGIEATAGDVIISSDALTYHLTKTMSEAKLFVLGTPELKHTISQAGFKVLDSNAEERPDYVIVGFDMTLAYDNLSHACRLIDKGVPYIATHADVRCPIEGGEFIPDCGAMIELIKSATGKAPVDIMGKPYHYIVDLIAERFHYQKHEIAMVGDRLSTDIAFGLKNQILSVLVLTGEATRADVEVAKIYPDIVLPGAVDILKYI